MVLAQNAHGRVGECLGSAMSSVELVKKMTCKQLNILLTITQRRNSERKDIESMKKIKP